MSKRFHQTLFLKILRLSALTVLFPMLLVLFSQATLHAVADDSVTSLQQQLTDTQTKLTALQKQQKTAATQLQTLSADITTKQQQMENQARSAQTSGLSTSFIQTLLSARSLSEVLQTSIAMSQVVSMEKQTLDDFKKDRADYETKLTDFQKNYEAASKLQKDLTAKIAKAQAEAVAIPADIKIPTTGTVDLNQVGGTVDIGALAAYMHSVTGGDAATWAHIIWHESRGQLDALNPSGAVGPFQSLGHGDTLGMTLGGYIKTAVYLYQVQGFYNAWLRWEQ
ncbi:MAG: hypothetical protein LBI11_06295 [Streptococcaceae bacterium]|nr:hypothetical protein [Streptococcaceae bacterium]